MRKYQVVNFAGIPYGKPDEMQKGRERYIDRQLVTNDFIWHPITPNKHQDVFKVLHLGHQQLKELHSLLLKNATIHSSSPSNAPLAMLHCEQVIGRVLRILNRPQTPTLHQMDLYHQNLDETLKLAQDLSGYGFNWRKLGRVLMALALCAAVASGLTYFLVSAPVSFALAGSAVFLGTLGWFLKKYSPANLEEKVTDFVNNVKRFDLTFKNNNFSGYADGHYYDDNGPNGPFGARDQIREMIYTYLPQNSRLPRFQPDASHMYDPISHGEALVFSLTNRVVAGDHIDELQQQFQQIPECQGLERLKHVAAISGLTVIENQNDSFSMINTTELYALTHLDPLGSENPAEALRQASIEYHEKTHLCEERVKEKSLAQQAYQALSSWGSSVYSFFGNSKAPSKEEKIKAEMLLREEKIKENEALCMELRL